MGGWTETGNVVLCLRAMFLASQRAQSVLHVDGMIPGTGFLRALFSTPSGAAAASKSRLLRAGLDAALLRHGGHLRRGQSRCYPRRSEFISPRSPRCQTQGSRQWRRGDHQARALQLEHAVHVSRPVVCMCSVLDCATRRNHQKRRDQRILNLEVGVEVVPCPCQCAIVSVCQIRLQYLRDCVPNAGRCARARASMSWKSPGSQNVANVSNWMRFGSQPATRPQPYHLVLIRHSAITRRHNREVCYRILPMGTRFSRHQADT